MKVADGNDQNSQEDSIESLMRLAGPREVLPQDVKTRLEKTFREELHLAQQRRRAKKIGAFSAIAALLVLAVMLSLPKSGQQSKTPMATVIRLIGTVLINDDGAIDNIGDVIAVGARLNSAVDGRVLLSLAGSATTIRLDQGTELVLQAENELFLKRGSIYIDTGDVSPISRLTVTTEFAEVTDIGTQYLITAADSNTRVAVREGLVRIVAGGNQVESRATEGTAQQVSISKTLQVYSRTIPKYGGDWSWINEIAPSFDTDNRHLIDFLNWVSRETGRSLQFNSNESRQAAHRITLAGSLQEYSPERALTAILSTTDLESIDSKEGAILIALRSEPE